MVVASCGLYSQFAVLSAPRLREWNLSHLFTSAAERRRSQERGYIVSFIVIISVLLWPLVTRVFLHLAAVKINSKSQERSQARAGCSGRCGGAITTPLIRGIAGLIVQT